MSLDAQRFMDLMPFLNMAWTSPLGIYTSIYLSMYVSNTDEVGFSLKYKSK